MTYEELESLHWINAQIKLLEKELAELEPLRGNKITDMPRSQNTSNPTEEMAILKARYIEKINQEKIKYWQKKIEILEFIENLENEEAKTLARCRFIQGKSWNKITREQYNYYCDIYTPRRWLQRYIEKINKKKGTP